MAKNFYGVKQGKKVGIYNTWKECEEQVKGHSGAVYKKFSSYEEAFKFVNGGEVEQMKISIDNTDGVFEEENLKPDEALAYVDGSFDLEHFTYSYGVVLITTEGKETYSGREEDEELAQMRNVAGEIKGAMVAMDLAVKKGKTTLYLHYDYTGIEHWAKGNWKRNKEGTKNYKEFYDKLKDKLDVKFIKVKAHSGVKYNEEADILAKEAIIN